jgi:nucleotide-binding universal stress UspA family protein
LSGYRTVVVGTDGSESSLRAVTRAGACGAAQVRTVAVLGLDGIRGRLLGSVPADATRRSGCDVLVVHTT